MYIITIIYCIQYIYLFFFFHIPSKFKIGLFSEIAEWHKREVIRNKSLLREYPSIIKYIAGHKGDGQEAVKVYLSEEDEKAKQFFKKECRKVLEDPDFEFVSFKKKKKILDEKEKLERSEEEVYVIENPDRIKLTQMIQECEDKIHAIYSNVIGIGISNVKRFDNPMQTDLGIIIYCLDKTIIPFGENPLPKCIAGWPCDVKEDFFMFGVCPMCPYTNPNLTIPGCSIGIPSDKFTGSAGFLYRSRTSENAYKSGFLTASHVAIKDCHELYPECKRLSEHRLGRKTHSIVHPSYTDNNRSDSLVGQVVESIFGNYGSLGTGLDFAVVKNDFLRQKGIICLFVFNTPANLIDGF